MIKRIKILLAFSLLTSLSFTFNVQAASVNIDELYKNAYNSTINVRSKGNSYGIKGPLNNETQAVINAVKAGMQSDILDARSKINLLPNSLLQAKRTFSSILDQFQHPVYERTVFLLNEANTLPSQQLLDSIRFLIKDIPMEYKSCYSSASDQVQGKMFVTANNLVHIALESKNEKDIITANKYIDELKSNAFITPDINNFLKGLSSKLSGNVNENTYTISKIKNMEGASWTRNNEILTLRKKYIFKNPNSSTQVRYCSSYNLDNKTSIDYVNTEISRLHGVSPDGKYVLYSEPKYIPDGDDWQKALDSGELLHHSIKLLNLSNAEITSLKTEYKNSDTEYFWISNDRILINYYNHWSIIDLNGNVIEQGNYTNKNTDTARISGFDINHNGNSLSGKIYYTLDKRRPDGGCIGVTICSMDIKTKSVTPIFYNKGSMTALKKGNSIIVDRSIDHGEISPGIFNRTFGAYLLDEGGNILRDINFDKYQSEMSLSPDGSKLAYLEGYPPMDGIVKAKVVFLKTGEVKELLVSQLIKHLQWTADGKSLSFATGDSGWLSTFNPVDTIDTYIVTFDK